MPAQRLNGRKSQYNTRTIRNHRVVSPELEDKLEIFDLSKLSEFPFRLLEIEKTDGRDKLNFRNISETQLFEAHSRYVIIGEANRRGISKEYIAFDHKQIYEAINRYILKALLKRHDPLGYFLVPLDRIIELRPYKRMLRTAPPPDY